MQFSKIRGVEGNNLKNPKNNQNKKISKALAFSLIELSIVLIIIGLLVAGVTGGASLIESAKIMGLISELKSYEQAVYTFKAAKDRLPGDIIGNGKIGEFSGQVYNSISFPFPYDGTDTANNHHIPDMHIAPWVDLYLEGITNFEPKGAGSNTNSYTVPAKNGGLPFSKNYKNSFFEFAVNNEKITDSAFYVNGVYGKNVFYLQSFDDTKAILPKVAKAIDKKIDDGVYNSGNTRSYCFGSRGGYSSYEATMNYKPQSNTSKGRCSRLLRITDW